jgi:enamine deaminase RidA (YjgF/YER057c/UK114 family)
LYWTPGTGQAVPNRPAGDRSDTYAQALNDLKLLRTNLATVGLGFGDVVYLRAFLGPDPTAGGKFDYDGWNRAYLECFNTAANPHKPARTTMAIPVFGGGGTVEIEVMAAFPGASPVFDRADAGNSNLRTYASPAPPWADGVAVRPGAPLYFSSAAAPASAGSVRTQALSALAVLKGRLSSAGLAFKDVVFLRAYIVPDAAGLIDRAGWSEAYQTCFNHPGQPHKPARTTISVAALPGPGQKIAIDVIAAGP